MVNLTVLLAFLILFAPSTKEDSFYSFQIANIEGKPLDLSAYKGKVVLLVNTASKCGYTPQYKALQELYSKYSDKGLVVLGAPSGNFGGQEFDSNKEIQEFCSINFKVSFPMTEKVEVKGDKQHPLFKHLTTADNPDFKGDIRWNFEKFLISKDGKLVRRFRSGAGPGEKDLLAAVEKELAAK